MFMSGWVGRKLGEVRIDSLLARGGTAEVYLGTHTALQRPVAIKILNAHFQEDPLSLERFKREARAVAMLRHPNIIQVYDFSVIDGRPVLVTEFLAAGSLTKYLLSLEQNGRKFELPEINRFLTAQPRGCSTPTAAALSIVISSRTIF
jgi:serine/threonine-protein kinase